MDTFEKIIQLSEERLITPSGLFLVGQLLGKSRFIKKCNTMKVDSKRSQSQIKNGDILLSYIGLLCQGKPYMLVPYGKPLIIQMSKETVKRSPRGSCIK